MFASAYAWVIAKAGLIAGFAICALALFLWGYIAGANKQKDKQAAAQLVSEKKSTEQSAQLAQTIENTRRINDEANAKLTATVDVLINGLRNRTSRKLPNTAAVTCEGATGKELSREDAEFLTRESAESQHWQNELTACYSREDALRNSMCIARTGKPCI